MSLGPIDLQAALSSSKEVEKVQQSSHARQQHAAQGFDKSLEARLSHEATSVREVAKLETEEVKREEERRNRRNKRKRKKPVGDEEPHGEIYDPHADVHELNEEHDRDLMI